MSLPVRGPRWSAVVLSTVAAVFLIALPALTQGPGRPVRHTFVNGFEAVEGEVLVKYRDDRASVASALESVADAEGVETLNRRGVNRLRSRGLRTSQLLARLGIEPDVEYVEPNYVLRIHNDPNDPMFNVLWGLFNNAVSPPQPGGGMAGADIDAPAAWDISTGSRGQVVGIVDTGIDYNHLDLVANIWSAPSSFQVTIGGQLITCAAGTHGFNTITRTCDPMDDNSHGTHVAGTIGGVGNNGRGVAGVNWTASMMGLKFLGASGSGYTSDAVLLLDFAVQVKTRFASTEAANLRVLSNSWGGGGYSTSMFNAINAANASDMLFVASAGNDAANNDTTPKYPASYPNVNMVAVASSTNSDQRSSFSNYGATSVHLAAPGSSILSTTPNDTYGWKSGTSMAAPHVSGAGALALSMCAINTAQLKTLILQNVDLVPALSGLTITGGRLNVASMVQNCPYPKVTGLTVTPSAGAPQPLGSTITWTAIASGGQGPYEYRWLLWDGSGWTVAQAWGPSNTFVWTPSVVSDAYRVVAEVRSAWNTGAREVASSHAFPIKPAITSLSISPNVTSPQAPGTTVTWTATAAGGEAPLQYQWVVWDGAAWTLARGWATSNSFVWSPSAANANYRVQAQVRSNGSSRPGELTSTQAFVIQPLVTSVTVTSSVAAPQPLGSTITWTAIASGGQGPYQYRWLLWDGSVWTVAQAWGAGNSFVWTPNVARGAYSVVAEARSAWNTGARELASSHAFPIKPAIASLSIGSNLTAPQAPGTTVTWTATAVGGQAPLQYQWVVWDGAVWTLARGWSTSNTFAWTPTVANGSYRVQAQVRSAWSSGAGELTASKPFPIKPPVSGATLTADRTAPQPPGTTVTWTATASGGEAPYEYQFLTQLGGSSYVVRQPWSTSNVFAWTPGTADANAGVMVQVRSGGSTGASEYSVTVPFAIRSFASVTLSSATSPPMMLGRGNVWIASASGGAGIHSYQFSVWDGVAWTVMRPWSLGGTSFSWSPTVANPNYKVAVHVRSSWNTGVPEDSAVQSFPVLPPVASVSLTPGEEGYRPLGTSFTFTAAASGGQAPYQYQWSVRTGTSGGGSGVYTVTRSWDASNVFSWTPAVPDVPNTVRVEVRGSWNSESERATSRNVHIKSPVSDVTLTPTLSSPQPVGSTIRWEATPIGGQGSYEYRWLVFNGSVWTFVTGWTSNNKFDWTPTTPNGDYRVAVSVRSWWNEEDPEFTAIRPFVIQ